MQFAQRLRLPLLVIGLLAALYLLLIQERVALPNRAAMALWNLAHLPLFFALTLLFDQAIRNRYARRPSLWLQLLLPPLIIFAFGTEWLQALTDRQPSWRDAFTNCAGIALGTIWLGVRRYFRRGAHVVMYGLMALLAVGLLLRPALFAYVDRHSSTQFPQLSSFESFADSWNWSLGERSALQSRDGQFALHVQLPPLRFAGSTLRHFPSNWLGYGELRLSVFNPGVAPLPLSLRVHDRQHELGRQEYHDRFNYNFSAAPGWTDIVLPLSRIHSGPRERKLDLSAISALRIFYQGTPTAGETFFIDAVALHGHDAAIAMNARIP